MRAALKWQTYGRRARFRSDRVHPDTILTSGKREPVRHPPAMSDATISYKWSLLICTYISLYIKYIDTKTKLYKGLYEKDKTNDWGSKRKNYSDLSHRKKTEIRKKKSVNLKFSSASH